MNPLIVALVGFASVLDLAFVVQLQRRRADLPVGLAIALQLAAIVAGLGALFGGEPISSIAVWIMLGAVNLCLGLAGLGRQPMLASLGLAGTVGAIALILLHSFASLALIAAAGTLCLGAVLFPRRGLASA
ncbi:MAG: hypothetical protein M3T56_15820 [Chloroflexota bacterium]|nr:hypothetical protein [Chloroflexota bacterium]